MTGYERWWNCISCGAVCSSIDWPPSRDERLCERCRNKRKQKLREQHIADLVEVVDKAHQVFTSAGVTAYLQYPRAHWGYRDAINLVFDGEAHIVLADIESLMGMTAT